ncbi:hypothetical protein [Actinophytocola glycyrrhizae]|uniref:AAA domain-containing protein n=1 Tax=Actinophytocola glycyrrhizae TaxID=2044873 RepID=A0ABV9S0Q0_9PSEU
MNHARRLTHVRWIAGGTGAGKSTVARDLAPLLTWPEQAALPPAHQGVLRARARRPLRRPGPGHGQLGQRRHAAALANRLGRDALWDAEIRRQARETGLPVIEVDGSRAPESIATELAQRFRLQDTSR